MNEDNKTVGKAILISSIAGLILLFLVQVFALMNLKISNSPVNNTVMLAISLVVVFLVGLLAEALVSKTKKPLTYGMSASTIAIMIIVAVNMLIGYLTIANMQANVQILLNTMLESIQTNTVALVSMLFVSGIGVCLYWWVFNKNKEKDWVLDTINETKGWKKYLISLALVLAMVGLGYLYTMYRWLGIVIALVDIYLFSVLIVYLVKGIDWKKTLHVFGANLIMGAIVALAIMIPALLGTLSRDLNALGISIVAALVIGFFAIAWLVTYPFFTVEHGILEGLRRATKAFKNKFIPLVGMLTILYITIFTIQIVQGIVAWAFTAVNTWIGLAIDLLISVWVLEIAIIGMKHVVKSVS